MLVTLTRPSIAGWLPYRIDVHSEDSNHNFGFLGHLHLQIFRPFPF